MKSKAFFLVTLISLFGITLSTISRPKQDRPFISGQARRPEVILKNSPGSPLEIINIKSDATTPEKPEIEFTVLNKVNQGVIAYAVRFDTFSNRSEAGGSVLINAPSIEKVLQPGQVRTHTLGNDVTYRDPVKKIYLYIDYVQLADGSSWGPDKSKSSESLAGQRAAARLFITRMRNLMKTHGASKIVGIINEESVGLTPPPDVSPDWLKGFRLGIGIIKDRLRQAYKRGGVVELEAEINKPFDASGENR